MMKEIKKVSLKSLMLVTGILGLLVGLAYSVIFGVLLSSLTGIPSSTVGEIIYLTIAFGIGSALMWLIYGILYNYLAVPLIGGIKIDI
ncbi:MAG: hypothetical protein ABIH25_05565 [Candidatus Woesearchaeota archaeon]